MAGHSHWAGIKHKKDRADKQRSKIFAKLSKEITVAAKLGDKNPEMNPRLRSAIQSARSSNMPKDNILRAIEKSKINLDSDFENLRYEGFGPCKIAVIVEALTDNKNRTASNVRTIFQKSGGSLGTQGSASHNFKQLGIIKIDKSEISEDKIFELAIEAGAEDVLSHDDGSMEVVSTPEDFESVRDTMVSVGLEPERAEVTMRASTQAQLEVKQAESMLRLLDILDELDDVQQIYSNADMPDNLLEDSE